MGFEHMHGKHKHPKREFTPIMLEKRADCPNNSPYIAPAMNAKVDSTQPLSIVWNPTCFSDVKTLDIWLTAPDGSFPRIHAFTDVPSTAGNYTALLKPRWWSAKAEQQLQIAIVAHGLPIYTSTFVGGPIITATYTAPADGSTPAFADVSQNGPDDIITRVGAVAAPEGVTPGGKAAAVLVPLIFIGLCIGAYIKWKRGKENKKRKAWTEKVDQRMSTISVDWKSVSGAGANAAIRNSIAVGMRGSRTSSAFAFGAIRPSSTFAVEDNNTMSEKTPSARTTTGVGLRNPGGVNPSTERVSRVSFAPDTRTSRVSFADSRPSGESRRTRAYHSAYVPPVPALPADRRASEDDSSDDNTASGTMSPRQTEGAMSLTPEAIRAKIAKNRESVRKDSMDEVMPALAMMRTGNDPTSPDDFLFHQNNAAPTPPPPAYIHPHHGSPASPLQSPIVGSMPMEAVPASVMSPDEMLRAYAERKKSMNSPMSPVRTESPVLPGSVMSPDEMLRAYAERKKSVNMSAGGATHANNSNSGGMRALYNATGQLAQTTQQYQEETESTYSTGSATAYSGSDYNAAYADAYAAVGLGYPAPATPVSPKNVNNPFLPTGPVQATPYPFGHHPNGSIGVGSYGGAQYTIGDDDHEEDVTAASGMAGRGAYRG